ncbi:hypothetical protein BH23BAC3_BH23BAC3_07320 [soil metagenome]
MDRTYNLNLSSTFRESEKIPDFVDQIRDECELDEECSETFKLVLSEAVTNAILHGNKQDKKKKVDIRIQVSGEAITADVKDQGEGFNPDENKNPLSEENLLDTSGRGLFLIRQFTDHVEFSEKGTHLHFRVDFAED